MDKYSGAGIIGFLVNVIWMLAGGAFFESEKIFTTRFYIEVLEKDINVTTVIYALLAAVVFGFFFRVILISIKKYDEREKWLMGMSAGIGFLLASGAMTLLLWQAFKDFGF